MIEKCPSKVWHASRSDISRPTIVGRTVSDNHDNSGLGIFCATGADEYIVNFGPYIFELDLIENPRALRMKIREFAALSRDSFEKGGRPWFEAKGKELAQRYDVIELEEIDGRVAQVILLTDDVISSAYRHDAASFIERVNAPVPAKPGMRPA